MESYHAQKFEALGIPNRFMQDSHSRSVKGTLRGLHYQFPSGQAKLLRVTHGEIYDVCIDIRIGSPTFGKHFATILNEENGLQMFVPEGFAHGFFVLSNTAELQYKCTDFYAPEHEHGIAWNDADLGISWPSQMPLLSAKDSAYPCLRDLPSERLPLYNSRGSL